ncbi:MAG: DUF1573 domain-containing protein, partial [Saprospiraceae bacterium]|nr:DUF1573 domain-containing protein [Saprospiraceae bacterium]
NKGAMSARLIVDQKVFDFDTILEGDRIQQRFTFENGGGSPLLVANIENACGCTTVSWPYHTIASGDTSSFLVEFDSKSRLGYQRKSITIRANTIPTKTVVYLQGYVAPKR